MEIRTLQPNEVDDVISRISKAFGYKAGEGGVGDDFPQLYNPSNHRHLWGAFVAGKLAAHSAFYPSIMKVEGLPLPVAGIGGVFTDEKHRNLGLGSKLVQKCTEEAHRGGAALAFLWSDQHDFYAKLGFYLVGRQWTITLEPSHAPLLRARGEKLGVAKDKIEIIDGAVTSSFLVQSLKMQEKLNVGIARSPEEHQLLLASDSCRVISAWAGKDLAAYFVIGKGKDLINYIHEWAGDDAALCHLAAACLEKAGVPLHLITPQFMPDEVNWIYALDELGIGMRGEQMALVKMLDFPKLRRLIADYMTRIGLQASDLVIDRADGAFIVEWKKKNRLRLDEGKFLRLLFGPEMPANQELKGFLPVRLWYWGMDSV